VDISLENNLMPIEKEELEQMLATFKADITTSFTSQTQEILTQVDKKNGGTAAALTKEFQKTAESLRNQMLNGINTDTTLTPEVNTATNDVNTASPTEKLSLKALQSQIETLRQEREQQALKLEQSERNNQLNTLFSSKKSQFPDKATKAFLMENEANLKQEDGNWYLVEGDSALPLSSAVDSFLNTDFGQTFQPASKGRGLNMKPAVGEQSAGTSSEVSLNDALLTPDSY
jgi:hypothetical protein